MSCYSAGKPHGTPILRYPGCGTAVQWGPISTPECSQWFHGTGRAKIVLRQRWGLIILCWQRVSSVTETSSAVPIQDIPVWCLISCCCVISVLLGRAVATAWRYQGRARLPSSEGSVSYFRYITLVEISFTETKDPPVPSQRKRMACELLCWCLINYKLLIFRVDFWESVF